MYNRKKLKPFVIPSIYGAAGLVILLSAFFLLGNDKNPNKPNDENKYVNKETIDKDKPVVSTNIVIARPYNDAQVKLLKSFYDYKADEKKQQESLIFYENTYMQNSGVDYGYNTAFNVLSILEGTVIKVSEDNILGKYIEIRYTNDLMGEYQCLGETSIKENDKVSQGQIIGKSGTCNIAKDLNNHLHFELFYKGSVVDPELYFDKNLKDL
jgi:stage II sporulation protein Q